MINSSAKTILVIGATGNQGGAVARALATRSGFQVRALVHGNSGDPRFQGLKDLGAEIAEGDLDDRSSLVRAMTEVHGVFSAIAFQKVGVAKEEERGKRVADVAKESGVNHFLYSSVGGAERNSGVPHFESKWHVEQHIRAIGLPFTILRPVTFMMNLMETPGVVRFLALSMSRGMDSRPLQMIAVEDIGKWAAHVFQNRERFLGKAIEIAGDEVTFSQIISAYRNAYGKTPRSVKLPVSMLARGDIGKMVTWIANKGYAANLADNRGEIPDLLTFESFVSLRRRT